MPTQSIPASAIVQVTPGVLGAGGTGLQLNGLFLSNSTQIPIGQVASFPSVSAVAAAFGDGSDEAAAATVYFLGFDNSNIKPGAILFTQYPSVAVPAYVRGGPGLTLYAVKAVTSGTLSVTINGVPHTSGSINLGSVGSFSAAATAIQTALAAYDAVFTAAISGTTMTVSGSVVGAIAKGQIISGSGITPGTTVVSGSGTTWTVSASQTVASTTISAGPAVVSWNSISQCFQITGGTTGATSTIAYPTGSVATALFLTATKAAVLSQGADLATPIAFMTGIADAFQGFATFSTIFEPDTADKVLFAEWNNGQNNRFCYVMPDSDEAPTTSSDTTSAGYQIQQAGYSGTELIYDPFYGWKGAFFMGATASIDFSQSNGRITFAFKSQTGLVADVTSQTIGDNLIANGYNFYGAYATAAQGFVFYYPGSVTGKFLWADSYINEIQLNASLQLAMMELLTTVRSIPYNAAGNAMIAAAAADPINAGVNFGSVVSGVTLSALQAAEVNAAAGLNIVPTLFQKGWYLLIQTATAIVRQGRGSPPITLFYCDGGSVQKIAIASIDIL